MRTVTLLSSTDIVFGAYDNSSGKAIRTINLQLRYTNWICDVDFTVIEALISFSLLMRDHGSMRTKLLPIPKTQILNNLGNDNHPWEFDTTKKYNPAPPIVKDEIGSQVGYLNPSMVGRNVPSVPLHGSVVFTIDNLP